MIVELFGKQLKADQETKCSAKIFGDGNDKAQLFYKTLREVEITIPVETVKECSVNADEFVSLVNEKFAEHNKSVDTYYQKLRESIFEMIERYCGEWSKEKRKELVETAYQKDIYEMLIGGNFIRVFTKYIYFFDKDPRVKDFVYNPNNNPIRFDITEEEFKQIQKMFLNF